MCIIIIIIVIITIIVVIIMFIISFIVIIIIIYIYIYNGRGARRAGVAMPASAKKDFSGYCNMIRIWIVCLVLNNVSQTSRNTEITRNSMNRNRTDMACLVRF